MWYIASIRSSHKLWCSDGKALDDVRGGIGECSRIIVDKQGFLDITEFASVESQYVFIDKDLNFSDETVSPVTEIDANGSILRRYPETSTQSTPLPLRLQITLDGTFTLALLCIDCRESHAENNIYPETVTCPVATQKSWQNAVTGILKPLPQVLSSDAAWIDRMISARMVPYPDTEDSQGKSEDEIRALGLQLFPFSPYSFQLAMVLYNWTTASFTRMVLLNMFQYSALKTQHSTCIDQQSVARAIWMSNWASFTAQNTDFMASFMMKPAFSLLEVEMQLLKIRTQLEKAVIIENRVLSAAMQSLPRTSVLSKPYLFSGQLDMSQLTIDNFAISFLECPENEGPLCQPLKGNLEKALSTFLKEGKVVTTKVTWSFSHRIEDAMHYSNGLLLVVNFSPASMVWETASYITPLSADPEKVEYTFPPGSQFEVQSVAESSVTKHQLLIITLQPKIHTSLPATKHSPSDYEEILPSTLTNSDISRLLDMRTCSPKPAHTPSKTGGRKCKCSV